LLGVLLFNVDIHVQSWESLLLALTLASDHAQLMTEGNWEINVYAPSHT
jgi:hypothetical protein